MSKLYLIRHAQASFLSSDYDNLSEHGHLQSTILGNYFISKKRTFDEAYVGPLKRHHQTYQRVKEAYEAKGLIFPKATEIGELKEYEGIDTMGLVREQLIQHHANFRKWFKEMENGATHQTKMKMVVTYLNMWATNTLGFNLPQGAQTFVEFRQIAEIGLEKVMQGNEKSKTVAVFSSGGCISAMLGKILDISNPGKTMGFNLVMRNTAISEVLFSGNRLSLMTFNTLPHLSEEMVTTM